MLELLQRAIAIGSTVFSAVMLILSIRKMREEIYIPKIAPILIVLIISVTVGLYIGLTGTPISWWIGIVLLLLGLAIGWVQGHFTRLYYRGPIIVGKRTVGYLLFWGLAYMLTVGLTQTGSALVHAIGVLTLLLASGIALGDNLILLIRQLTLKPPPNAASSTLLPSTVSPKELSMVIDFQHSEEEYFKLRGQFATGRINRAQFEAALKNLMVQDAQGRWWVIGLDSGKWNMHNGTSWIEANPVPESPPQPTAPSRPADLPERGAAGRHTTQPAPATLTAPQVIVIQSPAPQPPTQQTPVVVQAPPVQPPRRSGCGCNSCLLGGCLALIALVLIVCIGGYLGFRSGAITQNTILEWVGLGPGDIEIDNFRDDTVYVSITPLGTADSPPSSVVLQVESFDIGGYRAQNPGRYRVDFGTTRGSGNIGTCNLTIKSGDKYQFVALPDKMVVNRANNPASLGTDYVITTSTLCR